jgi:hypothetical protein
MASDYFAVLGLAPGSYPSAVIRRRFEEARAAALAGLDDVSRHADVRRQLDELHVAYAALRTPQRQTRQFRLLAGSGADSDESAALCATIAASIEGGLLRHARRQAILTAGRRLGWSDFRTQLLIAQVQFGTDGLPPADDAPPEPPPSRVWARVAAAGVLATAMLLAMVRWLAL